MLRQEVGYAKITWMVDQPLKYLICAFVSVDGFSTGFISLIMFGGCLFFFQYGKKTPRAHFMLQQEEQWLNRTNAWLHASILLYNLTTSLILLSYMDAFLDACMWGFSYWI